MRILVFFSSFSYGGAQKQAAILSRHMHRKGHYVEAWGFPTLDTSSPILLELKKVEIKCKVLPEWPQLKWKFTDRWLSLPYYIHRFYRWPNQLRKFYDTLSPANFDIVIPFTPIPCLVTALHTKKLQFGKIIWNHRGGYNDAGYTYAKFLIKQIKRQNPVMVANSTAGAQFLIDTFSLLPEQVSIIHNVFSPDEYISNNSSYKQHNKKGSTLQLLHVANLFNEKDIWTVLNAMKRLRELNFQCHLHIAGFFPDLNNKKIFLKEISQNNLEKIISYHGAIDQLKLQSLLLNADIGLLSSFSEGLPNSVMEYMYARLPVIGTNIPGIREVLSAKNNEWLFPCGDTEQLVKLIIEMGSNKKIRQVLGEANRRRILEEFSEEKIMPKWEQLIENI